MNTAASAAIAFHDFHPGHDDFLQDVLTGLDKIQKEIPAKYFYDERGSALFDQISELEEYYPTRTEIGLLERYGTEIGTVLGPGCLLLEYGSGSSRKISMLLSAMQHPLAYMPIDICKEYLLVSSSRIAAARPDLEVVAICADYMQLTTLPQDHKYHDATKIIFFPGSTIGNCTPMEAIRLLKNALKLIGPQGGMLIGVDLKKDPGILHTAYNDALGVTARFNMNMLVRINHELGADFCLDAFRHHAFYSNQRGRIEMHLVSRKEQAVTINNRSFHFRENEGIHTENSYKYTLQEFRSMSEVAGFKPAHVWVDERQLFSLHYLTVH